MILIVFGSKSDERVYGRIDALLNEKSIPHKTVVCSAHRNPEELDVLLREKWDAIIAGAGLAAHLPGVAAARVMCPVIGVPCSGNYEGLDALLSVMQMPPGVPVLACPVDGADAAALAAEQIMKKPSAINIVEGMHAELAAKAEATLSSMGLHSTKGNDAVKGAVNIRFVKLEEAGRVKEEHDMAVHCPVRQDSKATDALMLRGIKAGVWVGLNRAENAAIAAAEITGKIRQVAEYREAVRKK